MSTPQWPDSDELVELLVTMDIAMDPAELQGVIVGRICGATKASQEDHLLSFSAAFAEDANPIPLKPIWEGAILALTDALTDKEHLDLPMLFPEKTLPLPERLESLAQWCRGFLFGLGIAEISEKEMAIPELREVVEDVQSISDVGTEDEEDLEGQDEAIMELIDYLRMVPLMVYTTLYNEAHPSKGTS